MINCNRADFIAPNERQLWLLQIAVEDMQIHSAHGARMHANQKLAEAGIRLPQAGLAEQLTGFLKTIAPRLAHRTTLFDLILDRWNRFEIVCNRQRVFPLHVFIASLDQLGH